MNTSQRLGMAIVVAGGVSAVGPAPAIADTTYTYIGNYFNSFTTNGNIQSLDPVSPFNSGDRMTISLTYSNPLPNNTISYATPTFWSISDGVDSFTNYTNEFPDFSISLQTNSSGNIISWGISDQGWNAYDSSGTVYATISSTNSGDSDNYQYFDTCCYYASSDTPGTWSDPVPGPTLGAGIPGLVFACGGLLVLWRNRRRSRVEPL